MVPALQTDRQELSCQLVHIFDCRAKGLTREELPSSQASHAGLCAEAERPKGALFSVIHGRWLAPGEGQVAVSKHSPNMHGASWAAHCL